MKKLIYILFVCLLTESTSVLAQETVSSSDTTVYKFVEQAPQYMAGDGAMFQFLAKNIVFSDKGSQGGTVVVSYIVDKTGKIRDAKVVKGIAGSPDLEKEALRVINLMPDWRPGYHKGNNVNVKMELPITFTRK